MITVGDKLGGGVKELPSEYYNGQYGNAGVRANGCRFPFAGAGLYYVMLQEEEESQEQFNLIFYCDEHIYGMALGNSHSYTRYFEYTYNKSENKIYVIDMSSGTNTVYSPIKAFKIG